MYQLTLYIILKFCVCQVPFANIFIYQYIKHTSSYPPSLSIFLWGALNARAAWALNARAAWALSARPVKVKLQLRFLKVVKHRIILILQLVPCSAVSILEYDKLYLSGGFLLSFVYIKVLFSRSLEL